jgi:membrane protease YdiL (CAAX protease family)
VRLWHNLPNRLVEDLPTWKLVFIVFFAFDMALGNLVPESTYFKNPLLSFLLLAIMIGSVLLLSRDFSRRIASGEKQLKVGVQPAEAGDRWILTAFRWLAPFTRYVVMFLIFLAVVGAYAQLVDVLLPSFSADQDIGIQSDNVWTNAGMAFLGCTEEYWRWAMIITVLVVVKTLARKHWETNGRLRSCAFFLAILVSSLLFGLGHYQEFTEYKSWSFIVLGIMGIWLALAAIVTRRFVVAVILHFVYDFLALTGLYDRAYTYIYAAAAVLAVVVLPLFLWCWRRVRRIQASAA